MTREELERLAGLIVAEPFAHYDTCVEAGRSIITYVVRACCAELTAEVERMKARALDADDETAKKMWSCYALEAATCKALLLQSFLPTEKPDA